MSKRISDLNEAKASRAKLVARPSTSDSDRPRLAERIVALAPLARAPLVPENDAEAPEGGLLRLDSHRFGYTASSHSLNALVPRPAAPVQRAPNPARLSRAGGGLLVAVDSDEQGQPRSGAGLSGFLFGLSIAGAIGIALYAYLV